jgi:HTH-type transcriptional regulator/antitoxin HigA
MDQQGLTRRDLEAYIGSRGWVFEVRSSKRALSMRMIRALHAGLDIPLEVLVQEPRRERQAS